MLTIWYYSNKVHLETINVTKPSILDFFLFIRVVENQYFPSCPDMIDYRMVDM